jgi:hypothetical protein
MEKLYWGTKYVFYEYSSPQQSFENHFSFRHVFKEMCGERLIYFNAVLIKLSFFKLRLK